MRYTLVTVASVVSCLFALSTHAQDGSKMKFGRVAKEEFTDKKFAQDTGAHAIVLSEIGSSSFEAEGAIFGWYIKYTGDFVL